MSQVSVLQNAAGIQNADQQTNMGGGEGSEIKVCQATKGHTFMRKPAW